MQVLKRLITATVMAGLPATAAHAAQPEAPAFPMKTIRIIVPFSPGSTADVVSRIIGQKITENWSQAVVVESRTGAGGSIAAEYVARSAPDGYTLLMGGGSTLGHNMLLYPKLPYDAVRDFAPIVQVVRTPSAVLVHPSLPVRSLKDLVALAKSRPGQLAYSTSGNATPGHIATELIRMLAGISVVHVPYRGANEAINDLRSGQVQFTINSLFSSMPYVRAGTVRCIATTGAKRAAELPDVPTVAESGFKGYEFYTWFGYVAPIATPREVIVRLNREVNRVIELPDVRQRLVNQGGEVLGGTPEEFGAFMRSEIERWSKIIKQLNLRVE
ncbi:MAG: Bug family tripartite tricarboxylate transporter substrate binding protein [Burkholderiales bacterium]